MSNAPSFLTSDRVKWARTVNDRWIVHEGLDVTTRRYLDELEQRDPARLRLACALAYEMAKRGETAEDPKPRFYGGLYSVATQDEAERYLEDYRFIASIHAEGEPDERFGEETRERISSLKRQIAALREELQS